LKVLKVFTKIETLVELIPNEISQKRDFGRLKPPRIPTDFFNPTFLKMREAFRSNLPKFSRARSERRFYLSFFYFLPTDSLEIRMFE